MAIWSQNRYIIGFLVLIILGHWSLILQGTTVRLVMKATKVLTTSTGVLVKAKWVPGIGCAITETNNTILAAIFIYSMCFDLIVLLLNMYKLIGIHWNPSSKQRLVQSRLSQMIFADGLIFFFIAYVFLFCSLVIMLTASIEQVLSQSGCHSLYASQPKSNNECYFQCTRRRILDCTFSIFSLREIVDSVDVIPRSLLVAQCAVSQTSPTMVHRCCMSFLFFF